MAFSFHLFVFQITMDRQKVARLAAPFILNGHRLMVHSRSRVVRDALLEAAKVSMFDVSFRGWWLSCESFLMMLLLNSIYYYLLK